MAFEQNGLENGADWSFTSEMELVRKDGSTVWTEITMNVLYDEAGTAKGFMGITRDITERRRAEEEAKRREKLQGVLEMAGAVCHELNQPLQVLMTSIDILLSETEPLSQDAELLRSVHAAVDEIAG
jgi:signal transduction histidine kinase